MELNPSYIFLNLFYFNPISTNCNGGRLCPPNNTGTPGFPDLPRALRLHTTSPNSFSENRSRGCSLGIVLGRSITHKSSSTCHIWMKEVSSRIFIHSRVASCQRNLIKTFRIKAIFIIKNHMNRSKKITYNNIYSGANFLVSPFFCNFKIEGVLFLKIPKIFNFLSAIFAIFVISSIMALICNGLFL